MFKKGQLVRSKETGLLFLIEGSGSPRSLMYDLGLVGARQLPCGTAHMGRFENCELIGNNYQAKQKCLR